LNTNYTKYGKYLVREIITVSLLFSSDYKVVQTPTTCDLHTRLSELLKTPIETLASSSGKVSATTANFWQSCNRIHRVLLVY